MAWVTGAARQESSNSGSSSSPGRMLTVLPILGSNLLKIMKDTKGNRMKVLKTLQMMAHKAMWQMVAHKAKEEGRIPEFRKGAPLLALTSDPEPGID